MYDKEGFLKDLDLWSEDIARKIATQENIMLSDAHWEIIYLVRKFYQTFERSPDMRALCGYAKKELHADKAKSIYLLQLFPNSPAKFSCKIAGLPKPDNCL
jgi:tRNA 2-thiouridine synthesizing protein E